MTDGNKEDSSFHGASNDDCWKLFSIATITSVVEYYIAWEYAGSSIAQADSIHAFIHSLWYGSPFGGEALMRFWRSIPIVSAFYMLVSGLCGITGNTLCLKILNRIKRYGPENDTAAPHRRSYQLFRK